MGVNALVLYSPARSGHTGVPVLLNLLTFGVKVGICSGTLGEFTDGSDVARRCAAGVARCRWRSRCSRSLPSTWAAGALNEGAVHNLGIADTREHARIKLKCYASAVLPGRRSQP